MPATKIVKGENDLASLFPELCNEWNYEKNGELLPTSVTAGSGKKVWWICKNGHEWCAQIYSRTHGNGCPICFARNRTSFPEQAIFYYLKKEMPDASNRNTDILSNNKELDIYLPSFRVGIEYDGYYWHQNETSKKREKEKYEACKELGITLIRIREGSNDNSNCDHIVSLCRHPNDNDITYMLKQLSTIIPIHSEIDIERDRALIIENYYLEINAKSLESLYPALSKEWNCQKNKSLIPSMFFYASNEKVWWICDKGHEWKAPISRRTLGKSTCPYCSGKKVLKGYNDLATTNPSLFKEWTHEKNIIEPFSISAKSHKKVWWKCLKGHEWQAAAYTRTSGIGCPICSGYTTLTGYNDLKTLRPNLASEWNYEKNGDLRPENISVRNGKRVWWKCSQGHEWQAIISNRSAGNGCPFCSGKQPTAGLTDLKTLYPDLAKQWNYSRNKSCLPESVLPGSSKKVWWLCDKCGNEWQAVISSRVAGKGCPNCAKVRVSEANKKAIVQLDEHGVIVAHYDSVKEASKAIGTTHSAVSYALSEKGRKCKGFFWEYSKPLSQD